MLTSLIFFAATGAPKVAPGQQNIALTLIPTGFTKLVGGYLPKVLQLSETQPTWVTKVPAGLDHPLYGDLFYQGKHHALLENRPKTGDFQLWVDAKSTGDLTTATPILWKPRHDSAMAGTGADAKAVTLTEYFGSSDFNINFKGVSTPVHFGIYAFDPNDPQPGRDKLANAVIVYNDFGFKSDIKFGQDKFPIYLGDASMSSFDAAGDGIKETMIGIDRRKNGQINGVGETYFGKDAINIGGTTLKLESVSVQKGVAHFKPVQEKVAEIPLAPDLNVGSKAISFTAKTMDGKTVVFPRDFAGKVVMLDFWATWCGPCRGEIPYSTAAYKKYHDQGFDILGITLDQANQAKAVTDFTAKNDMTWPQIYEGKFWDVSLVHTYAVQGIPFVLLVDGTTGKILATEDQLRGDALDKTIATAVSNLAKARN